MTKSQKPTFDEDAILATMETMRLSNGMFMASSAPEYNNIAWHRDHCYTNLAYRYLGLHDRFREGIAVELDVWEKEIPQLFARIASPIDIPEGVVHAKRNATTMEKVAADSGWGHDQRDAIGLLLYVVAYGDYHNISVIRNKNDREILQYLVFYLRSKEYWNTADYGMWEECNILHASSVGACVSGLKLLRQQGFGIKVPGPLIEFGERTLFGGGGTQPLYPYESRDICKNYHAGHRHDCDAGLLSLIWPYHFLNHYQARDLLGRLIDGYQAEGGEYRRLVQKHGLQRYWGDNWYRSTKNDYRGISAEWPMFFFWLSICFSQLNNHEQAMHWFQEGCKQIVDGNKIPELYQNGKPNNHTPLAWAHAIALIAFRKLPAELRKQFLP